MTEPSVDQANPARTDYSAAAGTILKEYKGEKVLMITDGNHYRTQDVHDLAFATAAAGKEKGIKGVGLEVLPRAHQPLIDALASGEITKQDFLEVYGAGSTSHFDEGRETNRFFGSIADAIQSGTKVYAHGTLAGAAGHSEEQARILEEVQSLAVKREIDLAKFKKQNADEIKADPKAFAEKMYAEADKKRDGMSKEQVEVLDDIKKTMDEPGLALHNTETGYSRQIARLHGLNHPTFNPIEELEAKVEESSGLTMIDKRQEQDPKISGFIKEDIPADGAIIEVYGRGHTTHSKDLDSNLRKSGVSVMIVDPNYGADDKVCPPNVPKDFCSVWPNVVDITREAVRKDADPNRYEMPDFKNDPTNIKKLTPDEMKALMDKPDALRVSSAPQATEPSAAPALKVQDPSFVV